jgi:hypothetical protein
MPTEDNWRTVDGQLGAPLQLTGTLAQPIVGLWRLRVTGEANMDNERSMAIVPRDITFYRVTALSVSR